MNIYTFQNFTKKPNSTARPTGTGTLHTCVFKDDCSIVNPVFVLDGIDMSVNYVQFNNRYYFVRDIVLQNKNIYELHCEIDVLATWKSEIGSSSQYVLRSSASSDGRIVDGFYPTRKAPLVKMLDLSPALNWSTTLNGGYYVIGVISGQATQTGAAAMGTVQYFGMTPASFNQFAQNVFTTSNWTDLQSADRYSFNPIQYIASVLWFPVQPPVSGQVLTGIKLGWEVIACTALVLTGTVAYRAYTVTPDTHPQASSRGTFLNASPFSEYILKFPPFGDVTIDGDLLINAPTRVVTARTLIDFISGKAALIVSCDVSSGQTGNTIIAIQEIQFGVSVQLSQIAADRLGVASGAINTVANVAGNLLTGNVLGAITGTVSGIVSAYQTAQPRVDSLGQNDAMLNVTDLPTPRLNEVFHYIVDEDNTNHGRPLCQVKTISSIAGYILCANSEVAITGTLEEKERIQQYMDAGFFYE